MTAILSLVYMVSLSLTDISFARISLLAAVLEPR